MEHIRSDGVHQGYFCTTCGMGGVNMYGMGRDGHRSDEVNCIPNPGLVYLLRALNHAPTRPSDPREET